MAVAFVVIAVSKPTQAQTFKVLHDFTGEQDGGTPIAELTMDRAGNLYGTAFYGGVQSCHTSSGTGCGTVFKLSKKGSELGLQSAL